MKKKSKKKISLYSKNLIENSHKGKKETNIENGSKEMLECFKYIFGLGRDSNEERAREICFKILKEKEKKKMPKDLICLGLQYMFGWNVDQGDEKALNFFHHYIADNKTEKGRDEEKSFVYYLIASIYLNSEEINVKMEKGMEYLKLSIKLGNCVAMCDLGCIYCEVDEYKDLPKAIDLLLKSINFGYTSAMCELSSIYYSESKYKNVSKSIELLEKAIKLGDKDALFYLARIYHSDPQYFNLDKAIELYEKSSNYGDSDSLTSLAHIYFNEEEYQDIPKAIEMYEKASLMGNFHSIIVFAEFLLSGNFVQKDPQKAVDLLVCCSDEGNLEACSKLALLHQSEDFFDKNFNKSAFYFLKCIDFSESDEEENTYRNMLNNLIINSPVDWLPDLHCFWPSSVFLDDQILTLLLVSKHRIYSSSKSKFMVKGIVLNIIKNLCQINK